MSWRRFPCRVARGARAAADAARPNTQRAAAGDGASFERKVAELERTAAQGPADASAQHVVGTFYFEKTSDASLSADERRDCIARGLVAEDRALRINPDYIEALVYKNILLRMKATMEPDPAAKDALIREAEALRARALQLQSSRAAEPSPRAQS